jgi:uncharacterized membrane protein YdjX (TVP38/TMEM64 family)
VFNKHRRLLFITIIIVIATVILILALQGRGRFYRRTVREIESGIRSLGTFSPAAVVLLIFISTAIPPLPIPVPLVEIASGLVFGFWYGFLLSWIAQIISSLFAFYFARYLGRKILKRFSRYQFLDFYINYLKRSGYMAVFMTRALLASPFNIVSFLAGLTSMNIASFTLATIIGTIPESLFYAFIGSIIKTTRLSLGYVFALVLAVAGLGLIITYIMIELVPRDI